MKTICIILALVVGTLFIIYVTSPGDKLVSVEPDVTEINTTTIHLPVITPEGDIGCGVGLTFVDREVPETTAVLDATYRGLFALTNEELQDQGTRNVVADETELSYNKVTIDNGVAEVYLTGNMTVGHCADPSFRAQIQEAAFQFNTVTTIEVYRNDERWDWCDYNLASPKESGCDTHPQYWIVQKEDN